MYEILYKEEVVADFPVYLSWKLWLIAGAFAALCVLYYQVEHNGSSLKEELLLDGKSYFLIVAAGFLSFVFYMPIVLLGAFLGSVPTARASRELELLRRTAKEWGLPVSRVVNHLRTPYDSRRWDEEIALPAGRPVEIFDRSVEVLDQGVQVAKRESRFALAWSALIAALCAPFGMVSSARAESERNDGPQVSGFVVADLEPDDLAVNMARVWMGASRSSSGCVVDAELVSGRMVRGFVWVSPVSGITVSAGRDFTSWIQTLPPPPKRTFCSAPALAREFSVGASASLMCEAKYDPVAVRAHYVRDDDGSRRAVGSLCLTPFGRLKTLCVAEYAQDGGRYYAEATVRITDGAVLRTVAFHSPRGTSAYAQATVSPQPWLELGIRGEHSPLISGGERFTAGASVLRDGARLRASWAPDLGYSAQLTYAF